MHDVAEINDPGDESALVEQHVVKRQVAVHDLGPQLRIAWGDVLVEAVEDAHHHRPPSRIGNRVQQAAQLRRLLGVPQQTATRRAMEEAAQRPAEPRGGGAVGDDGRVVQLGHPPSSGR